jgi:hypothetical protein
MTQEEHDSRHELYNLGKRLRDEDLSAGDRMQIGVKLIVFSGVCDHCEGIGRIPGEGEVLPLCEKCGGSGFVAGRKSQSLIEICSVAWKNATARETLSPLMVAIGDAIMNAPFSDRDFLGTRDLSTFAKRIARGSEERSQGERCLNFRREWTGEWEVTNADLEVWSRFAMWFYRFCANEIHVSPSDVISPIEEALRLKRMSQAANRFRASGLTSEHLKLLSKLRWDMDVTRGDGVSLYVNGKHPFGDSARAWSIFDILGWERTWGEDDDMPEEVAERAWNIFDELTFAAPEAAKKLDEILNY